MCQQIELFTELLWTQIAWELFYLLPMLLLIHTAVQVTSEVNFANHRRRSGNFLCLFRYFQGKRSFQILHDIINECDDADLVLSV